MSACSRGFTRIIWGTTVILLYGLTLRDLQLGPQLRLPLYIPGSLLLFWGMITLLGQKELMPRWQRSIRLTIALIFLQIYFSPFVHWFLRAPQEEYLMLNVWAFGITVFLTMDRLLFHAMTLAYLYRNEKQMAFIRVCRIICWGAAIIPALLLPVYLLIGQYINHTSMFIELLILQQASRPVLQVIMSLPLLLVLLVAFRIRSDLIVEVDRVKRTPEEAETF